ncbi:Inosine-uridine nucleoside N-ribohydrolase [Paenibacillus sp. yr247]|uniref:nucleoside hydrolase n=1 Tax=Paenibacillus sp. yr247 TaxID=1761880 RepID=UPI00087F058B|nr:nucleoside hydrolase [Paenibacillus sp. yr247]SDO19173.1 Inosine-uridine nucleoside N-ribohydrolase [Paenibacillus sp. yr247]
MINYPKLTEEKRLRRLTYPQGRIRMVLDTDTFNEIDDQFAVVYALKSPERLQIEAFYAAPFFNELSTGPQDGMEKSYRELKKITALLPEAEGIPIYRGSEAYLPGPETPVESEAARNLVERAMASSEEDPLYVVAIGAITNVASAILMEPRIIEKIVVIWLGGNALHWPDTKEFNLIQDLHASRIILDCGVPLVLIPCMGVATHLQTTLSELRDYVYKRGAIGKYLFETYEGCCNDHFAYSRVIWDIATIAYLQNDSWCANSLVASPILSEQFHWSFDASRHFIRYIYHIQRDHVFRDLFQRLE